MVKMPPRSSSERNIIRRYAIVALVSLGILSSAAIGGYVFWLGDVNEHRNAVAQNYLAALWQATFDLQADQLQQQVALFTRSDDTIGALNRSDSEALEEIHRPTFNRLHASRIASRIVFVDERGAVVRNFESDEVRNGTPGVSSANQVWHLVHRAITERKIVTGIDLRDGYVPMIAVIIPVFHEHGRLVGAVYLAHTVAAAFVPIAKSTRAVLAMVKNDTQLVASSDMPEAQNLFATLPYANTDEHRALGRVGKLTWERIVVPLDAGGDHQHLDLVSFTDATDAVKREQATALRVGTAMVVSLGIALLLIYGGVVREGEKWRQILELQVAERTRDLVGARDQALAAERAMATFLANMTHELRTPLHGILSFAKFGVTKHASASADKLREFFTEIHASGSHLLKLVDNLLDLSKLRAGKMVYDMTESDLRLILVNVAKELALLAQEKPVALRLSVPEAAVVARVDHGRFMQVLRNLVSNAIKFSPREGAIDLSLMVTPAGEVQINVADQGVGIPEGELQSVFEPFVQSTRTRSRAGGTGLGLPICREIIEEGHRGRIVAGNNADGGACFTITLPAAVLAQTS